MRSGHQCGIGWLLFLAATIASVICDFVLQDGQLVVADGSGITTDKVDVSSTASQSDKILSVTSENVLKLTFHITGSYDGKDSKGFTPHQVHLLATGVDTKLHWTSVIKVRGAGKAKWELDLARAPTDFLSLSPQGKIQLEIVLADPSPKHKPLRRTVATIEIPSNIILPYPYWDTKDGSAPSNLELEKYGPQPPIDWTFRAPRKPISPIISVAYTAVVLSPWFILLLAWSTLSSASTPGFKLIGPSSTSTIIFLATIASQEVMILTYWTSLRLYQYLPIAFLLTLPLILSGRTALSELRARRKRNPISASHVILSKIHGSGLKGKGKAD
ncbi:Oligosaccharyltransferase subunit Ribophorin II-domain-containing protein [Melampsora americana]|nr:Oligosaccharyltransferase subunit Ribophorin II-domain-containing protein [Melampsora americana]